jgi:hypothetical protein
VTNRLPTDWEWRGSEAYDDGDVVRVIGSWTRHVETEPDGYPVFDDLFTTTKLNPRTGEILSEETHGIHPLRDDPKRVAPDISCTFGSRSGVRVRDERLALDETFGEAAIVSVTPDERRMLVATDKAWLLLLQRA